MQHKNSWPFLLVLFLQSSDILGQNTSKGVQGWTDLTLTHFYNPELSLGGDFGLRNNFPHTDWTQIYFRPTLAYSITPSFRASGGIASFNTFNKEIQNLNEFRAFQDFHVL